MSDETLQTGVSIRDYVDSQIKWLRDYVDALRITDGETRNSALTALEKRLEGMNEFRAALKDQVATFVSRTEMEKIESDIRDLHRSRDIQAGKASQNALNVTLVIALLALAVSALNVGANLLK